MWPLLIGVVFLWSNPGSVWVISQLAWCSIYLFMKLSVSSEEAEYSWRKDQ